MQPSLAQPLDRLDRLAAAAAHAPQGLISVWYIAVAVAIGEGRNVWTWSAR